MSERRRAPDLTGKVALVTGGSRGIGLAIARGFAEAGADVVIVSRKLDACVAAAADIGAATGRRALGLSCHVGHWSDVGALAERVYAEFGRCDVLVNNAGMTPLYPDLVSITEDYYDKVMGVNLKGPFRLASLVGARMRDGEGGSIINVSTVASTRPSAGEAVYCAAKAGLNAMTIALAEAYGPKVRVNALLPGLVLTDMSKGLTEKQREELEAATPLGRPGVPEDYVGPTLWLASEASAFVTGALIRVDGGAYRQT